VGTKTLIDEQDLNKESHCARTPFEEQNNGLLSRTLIDFFGKGADWMRIENALKSSGFTHFRENRDTYWRIIYTVQVSTSEYKYKFEHVRPEPVLIVSRKSSKISESSDRDCDKLDCNYSLVCSGVYVSRDYIQSLNGQLPALEIWGRKALPLPASNRR
jgi:hypothetical protein